MIHFGTRRYPTIPQNTIIKDFFFSFIHKKHKNYIYHIVIRQTFLQVRPCEIYNLAAQSHVKVSFEMPEYTAEVVAVGTLRLLDAIKTCGLEKSVKFYQASTSELFGKVQEVPQSEKTPFYPRLVYLPI